MTLLRLVPAFAGGVVLGLVYFGILWAVVRRLPDSRHPALLAGGSLLARLGLLAAGLLLVMDGSWIRLLAALAGLMVARWLLVRRIRLGIPRGEGEASWN